jgi:lysophospholipase L1-like esterase
MSPRFCFLVAVFLFVLPPLCRADLLVKDGQKVAFLGDSITQYGWYWPGGYVKLVTTGFAGMGVHITPIPAGVSGNTSADMLARVDTDVISKKPDWVTISCGVNDVWRGPAGVALEPYKQNMTTIVDKCQAAGIRVLIMTSTPIGEDLLHGNNETLIPYNDFLRQLAQERHLPLAEQNGAFQAAIRAAGPHLGYVVSKEGLHPNSDGNQLMAKTLLEAFGASDAQIAQAQQAMLQMPDGAFVSDCGLYFNLGGMTIPEYNKLKAQAAAKKMLTLDYCISLYMAPLRDALNAHANDNPPAGRGLIEADANQRFLKAVDAMPNP